MCLTSRFFRFLCSHVRIFAVGFHLGISPTNAPCQHVEEDLPLHIWPTWWPAVIIWTQGYVRLYVCDICKYQWEKTTLFPFEHQTEKRQSCRNGNSQAFARHCGVHWVSLCFNDWLLSPTTHHPRPLPSLVLILWDVSVARVCECQWKAALWLFYELHYWFPILLRTENVIMHRPYPNPPHPRQTDLLLSLPSFAFLSLTLWLFINLSFSPAFSNAPPAITWPF